MFDKLFTIGLVVLLGAIPTFATAGGYVMLTSHLHGATAAVMGWFLFLGGFGSLPFFGAGIAEVLHAGRTAE